MSELIRTGVDYVQRSNEHIFDFMGIKANKAHEEEIAILDREIATNYAEARQKLIFAVLALKGSRYEKIPPVFGQVQIINEYYLLKTHEEL